MLFLSGHAGDCCGGYLGDGDDQEGPPSRALCDDGEELGVDGTEVVVMDILGDGNAVETVLPVADLAVHISKLGASIRWTP